MPPQLLPVLQDAYIINEGGYSAIGAAGAATIAEYYKGTGYTHICCATGTGTMMAGLIKAATDQETIVGIPVLKNNLSIQHETEALLTEKDKNKPFSFIHDYQFGGYAKYNIELIEYMNRFYSDTGVPTDFVYTAKLVYGVYDLVPKNYFPSNSRLLIIHSGGLQGNHSLKNGMLIF
jgi:1-aminocyclopropane-1-carboxylate deaminase